MTVFNAPRFKVCCIQSLQEAERAVAAGAAAVGLVAEMPSGPGPIPDPLIARICDALPKSVLSVLLTSRTAAEAVIGHVTCCRPRAVQLVDAVEDGTHTKLRRAHPDLKIIQVIHVASEESMVAAQAAAESVDMLLLDSGSPDKAVKELGGTGRTHDWALSAAIVAAVDVPVWLAGGLNPGNVRSAVETVRPYGVDVCSGLRPTGALDQGLLTAFAGQLGP